MKINKFNFYIEITNACNFNCPFCPSGNINNHKYMEIDNFKRIINDISKYSQLIYFHVLGEPTIHPSFENMIKYTALKGLDFAITTNGSNLNAFTEDVLKLINFKKINISLQSLIQFDLDRQEVYLDELIKFLEFKEIINSKLPINLRLWNNKENTDVLNLNDKICQKLIPLLARFTNVRISEADEFRWPNLKDPVNDKMTSCLGGKKQLAILNNGNVCLCCLDCNGDTKLGNIFNQSIEEILTSKSYQEAINGFNNRKPFFELCKKCTYRDRF